MLRLWPDFLSPKMWIALNSDGIAIVRQTRGLQKRIVSQHIIEAHYIDNQVNLPIWQTLINQLDGYLNGLALKQKFPLNIVLSTDFVRYLMLPAQQMAMSHAEKNAYAQAVFTETYGAAAKDWHIKYQQTAPNKNALACAVDALLLAALKQLADKHQLKLNSVQPYLMAACNALHLSIAQHNGYLLVLENTKLLLLNIKKSHCKQLQVMPFSGDWQAVLHQMLDRELLLNVDSDLLDQTLLIYAPAQKEISLKSLNDWKMQRIGHFSSAKLSPQFSMLEAVL